MSDAHKTRENLGDREAASKQRERAACVLVALGRPSGQVNLYAEHHATLASQLGDDGLLVPGAYDVFRRVHEQTIATLEAAKATHADTES